MRVSIQTKPSSSDSIFYLPPDECAPHMSKRVWEFLQNNRVQVLPWPARSPDLNLIENVWSTTKPKLQDPHTYLPILDSLYEQLCEVWNKLPDTYSLLWYPLWRIDVVRQKALEVVVANMESSIKLSSIGCLHYLLVWQQAEGKELCHLTVQGKSILSLHKRW